MEERERERENIIQNESSFCFRSVGEKKRSYDEAASIMTYTRHEHVDIIIKHEGRKRRDPRGKVS